jgi:lipoyl-dependent peroxiredoxin subunit D
MHRASVLAAEPNLPALSRAGSFVAAALASRNAELTRAVVAEFTAALPPDALNGAQSAPAIRG